MFVAIACFLAAQVPVGQPPRLRTILPNGATIIVERIPNAKALAVQLFVSSRGTEETPISNGLRHLMEHLTARGPKGDLDERLETAGAFLWAETSRDSTAYKMNLPPGDLSLGLRSIQELMQMPPVTPESIQREALILEQEMALEDDSTKLSVAAWAQAFGEKGLDTLGNIDVIKNATPEMLNKMHRAEFVGPNLVIAVAGDVDLDIATQACSQVLASAPTATVSAVDRGKAVGGRVTSTAHGGALALSVPGWRYPETAARLAAAFAIASEADQSYVIYTPSERPGIVTIGRFVGAQVLSRTAEQANANNLFPIGVAIAKAWLMRKLQTPDEIAGLRGMLIAGAVDLKPEMLLENLRAMTPKEFAAAIEAFRSPDAITVVGN